MTFENIFDNAKIDKENIFFDVDMKKYTSFKAGGRAAALLVPQNAQELKYVLAVLNEKKIKNTIIGNGTNVLIKDTGYSGVIVKLGVAFAGISAIDEKIIAGGAALLSNTARVALEKNLTGFEFASGIPGSIGGAVFMNAGAYGSEMKDIIDTVTIVSRNGSSEKILNCADLGFGYRKSILKDSGNIVISTTLNLSKGKHDAIQTKMAELTKKRNEKQPVNYPSAGSFFKRPEGYFAGKLIEDSGLKGLTIGGAQVSALHSGFVINIGGATTTDIIDLMKLVQNTVYDKFAVRLEPEVRIIGD